MKYTITPEYRRMKSNERLRNGVLFYHKLDHESINLLDNGNTALVRSYQDHVFFVKRVRPLKSKRDSIKCESVKVNPEIAITNSSKKKNQVIVKFQYPNNDNSELVYRWVVLLSFDATYLIGLERLSFPSTVKYQYKKYLRSKIFDNDTI